MFAPVMAVDVEIVETSYITQTYTLNQLAL
jgi:hypothetical protein